MRMNLAGHERPTVQGRDSVTVTAGGAAVRRVREIGHVRQVGNVRHMQRDVRLRPTDADAFVPSFVLVLMLDEDTDVLPFGALARIPRRWHSPDDCVVPA